MLARNEPFYDRRDFGKRDRWDVWFLVMMLMLAGFAIALNLIEPSPIPSDEIVIISGL